jgi:hypothetical protein
MGFESYAVGLPQQNIRDGIHFAEFQIGTHFRLQRISGSLILFHEQAQKVNIHDLQKTDVWMPCGEAPVAHKFSIRRAMHLHAHLYKLDYSSDRGQNKMLPANIW